MRGWLWALHLVLPAETDATRVGLRKEFPELPAAPLCWYPG
jgi:hypothetical protein